MDLEFGGGLELKNWNIVPIKKHPVIECNDVLKPKGERRKIIR